MKLQDQVCTLEQGVRLVELGVKAEATFWHRPSKDGPHEEYIQYGWHGNALAPAFTVAELGEMLPKEFQAMNRKWYIQIFLKQTDRYLVCLNIIDWLNGKEIHPVTHAEEHSTEAQARAAMLIYLLENKLIKAK